MGCILHFYWGGDLLPSVLYSLRGLRKTGHTLEVPIVQLSLASLSLLVNARDYQLKSCFSFCMFNRKKKYLYVLHCISWLIGEVRKFFCFFSHLYFLLYKLPVLVLHFAIKVLTSGWLEIPLFAKDDSTLLCTSQFCPGFVF